MTSFKLKTFASVVVLSAAAAVVATGQNSPWEIDMCPLIEDPILHFDCRLDAIEDQLDRMKEQLDRIEELLLRDATEPVPIEADVQAWFDEIRGRYEAVLRTSRPELLEGISPAALNEMYWAQIRRDLYGK